MSVEEPEVVVLSVSFIEDMVQVEFVEVRKQTEAVSHIESMTVAREAVQDEADELEAVARELLDKMAILQRNPPETRRG